MLILSVLTVIFVYDFQDHRWREAMGLKAYENYRELFEITDRKEQIRHDEAEELFHDYANRKKLIEEAIRKHMTELAPLPGGKKPRRVEFRPYDWSNIRKVQNFFLNQYHFMNYVSSIVYRTKPRR